MAKKQDEVKGFLLRLPVDLYKWLKHVSVDRGGSINSLIVEALEEFRKRHPSAEAYPDQSEGEKRKRR